MSEKKCPECGGRLNLARYYEAGFTAVTRESYWCSNKECKLYGVMLNEKGEPDEKGEPGKDAS